MFFLALDMDVVRHSIDANPFALHVPDGAAYIGVRRISHSAVSVTPAGAFDELESLIPRLAPWANVRRPCRGFEWFYFLRSSQVSILAL